MPSFTINDVYLAPTVPEPAYKVPCLLREQTPSAVAAQLSRQTFIYRGAVDSRALQA
jgi:hypothetical protein